jgi:uncharacterized protein (DUF305 family)
MDYRRAARAVAERKTRMRRRTLASVLVAVLLVAGCAAEAQEATKPADPMTTAVFNDTDVMFLQMMLAHHEPLAKLLTLGRTRAVRDDVRNLAGEVDQDRAATTTTISGWLVDWGQPLSSDAHPDAHAAHGGLPLLDDTQLGELASLTGPDFDTAFLNVLIGHQHSAVELARMEVGGGTNAQAKDLARQTDETLRTQIQRLLVLVAG